MFGKRCCMVNPPVKELQVTFGDMLKAPDRRETWLTWFHQHFPKLTWCRNICCRCPSTGLGARVLRDAFGSRRVETALEGRPGHSWSPTTLPVATVAATLNLMGHPWLTKFRSWTSAPEQLPLPLFPFPWFRCLSFQTQIPSTHSRLPAAPQPAAPGPRPGERGGACGSGARGGPWLLCFPRSATSVK